MSEMSKPNVGADLRRIHAIVTRGLEVSIERSRAFAAQGYPDTATREGFVSYVRALASVLHGHHLTEDEVAFPFFQEKLPGAPFDEWSADHRRMELILEEIQAAIERVAAEAEAGESLLELNDALAKMEELWPPHIRQGEEHLSAQAADELMDLDEQIQLARQLAQFSQEHAGPDYLVVPFMLYNLTPEDRATMAQAMPPIVTQQLVPQVWKEKWASMQPFLLD